MAALGVLAGGARASAAPVAARWSVTVAPASAVTSPEVRGGRVYVGFATAGGTGRVRALDILTGRAGIEIVALLRLNDGSRICQKSFDERDFAGVTPAFDPTSGAFYVFDPEQRIVYKVSGTCIEQWFFPAGTDVAGFDTNSTRLFGAGGSTVFALDL
jgi:hypothetical protein